MRYGRASPLKWLDPNEHEAGAHHQEVMIAPGQTRIEASMPLSGPSIWTRLRYELAPDRADARAFGPIRGIIALPRLADYTFELRAAYAGMPRAGKPVTIHAEAVHPFTRVPVTDLKWAAVLVAGKAKIPPTGIFEADGLADFTFDLPREALSDDDGASIEITASLVVSAIAAWRRTHPNSTDLDALIRRGLVFLLHSRGAQGDWLSTQSTVRAMRAFADALATMAVCQAVAESSTSRLTGVRSNPSSCLPIQRRLTRFFWISLHLLTRAKTVLIFP